MLNRLSLPGLTRQSILFRKKMDARVKPAHDAEKWFHLSGTRFSEPLRILLAQCPSPTLLASCEALLERACCSQA